MNTKILFLDIDGVICTLRSQLAYGDQIVCAWDPTCCQMIKKLCIANGYQIVCASTWRFNSKIIKYLNKYDLFNLLYTDWRTGADRITRGEEISAWLKNNDNVIEYVIIDDDSDLLPEQLKRHIKTDYKDGFSAENLEKADELMGGKFKELFLK